jgi:5-methylthioadenosine/S-adenosylhomocysteine deaminase
VKKADLLVRGSHLITMAPEDMKLKRGWGIAIEKGAILDCGPFDSLQKEYESATVQDLGDMLLMPGLVNTHGHVPMIGYCGKMPDGLDFQSTLFNYMLPIEREFILRKDFVYLCTLLGCAELAGSGVTTSVEMYYEAAHIMRAFSDVGIRGVIGETVISDFPSPSGRSADEALDYIRALCNELPGGREGLVELAVAPHSAYSCNDETLMKCHDLAEKLNLPLVMHAQESPDETARTHKPSSLLVVKGSRKNKIVEEMGSAELNPPLPPSSFYRSRPNSIEPPLLHLSSIGFLSLPRILLAHCIYLEDAEIEALASHSVGVSYNGICNTQIGLAIAPVTAMRRAGIDVGIGSDGPLTNDRLDLLGQLLPLLCLQRHREGRSDNMSCFDMVAMATIEGARAIGLDKQIGSLEKGKKADIIGLSLNELPRSALYLDNDSVYSFIVKYAASRSVDYCLVNGEKPRIPDTGEIRERLSPVLREIRAWKPYTEKHD